MPAPRVEDLEGVQAALDELWGLLVGPQIGWSKIGSGPVTFGAKFTHLAANYECWWRKDALGVVWLRGLAKATVAAGVNDVLLSFAPGLRMAAGRCQESGFAVATNPTGASGERGGLVMFEPVNGTLVVREAVTVGQWVGLDSVNFLAEA